MSEASSARDLLRRSIELALAIADQQGELLVGARISSALDAVGLAETSRPITARGFG